MVNWCSGKKPVVTCVKLLSSYLPLDYMEDHYKPLPLECDRAQISIQNTHTHCRSNCVNIISVFVYESLINSFPDISKPKRINPLNPELNSICYLLASLGTHHFLHVSRIRVKLLTFRLLMSYIYGAPILDVSRSHTTTQHSR